MNKTLTSAVVALLATAAVGSLGCAPAAPAAPTWKDDIRPFMVARCIRCHADPQRPDPALPPNTDRTPSFSFDFVDLPSPLPTGLLFLTLDGTGVKYLRGEPPATRRMPPPPAEAVEEWQIEMMQNWIANPR